MTLNEHHKGEQIQRYFDLVHKLKHCNVSNEHDAELKLIELRKERSLISSELEESQHLLSVLNSRKQTISKTRIIFFFDGLVFDVKDLWKNTIGFRKEFLTDEFKAINLLTLFLITTSLLLLVLLLFSLNILEIITCFVAAFTPYVFLTVEASRRRFINSLRNEEKEQRKELNLKISNLEKDHKGIKETIDYLEFFARNGGLNHIQNYTQRLEAEVKKCLEEDVTSLIMRGMEKLKIKEYDDSEDAYQSSKQLEQPPIVSLIGKKSARAKESSVIITNRELEEIEEKNNSIYIKPEDYYEEKGLDGRIRHSVYEFIAIFLCDNFLSYYRCYWNFLKRASVDEETCEYMYDSIVSIKTQDKSSLRLKDPNSKRIYRDLLSITTMDGNVLYLHLSKDRKENLSSTRSNQYISDIDAASHLIRYWIRQRRVDYFRTEDRNM